MFSSSYGQRRLVYLPPDISAAARTRLLENLERAVRTQAELAHRCPAILQVRERIELSENAVAILHEPAAPADLAAVLARTPRPDGLELRWLTWSLATALAAAQEQRLVHGGVQFLTLYQDSCGRLKLGDFGIAPAFESACGADRRRLSCAPPGAASGETSGVWELLPESEHRPHGWLAPFFAHELFEDAETRFNGRTDQFALGVLLFLWATGAHPYGAALDDPSLLFYFHLEPFPLAELRPDWRAALQPGDNAPAAEHEPLRAWAAVLERLLASDSRRRFANTTELADALAAHVPPAWPEATRALTEGLPLLDAGQPEAFLARSAPYADHPHLPELWRRPLTARIAEVQRDKTAIARRKALSGLLRAADAALTSGAAERARALADQVLKDSAADDRQRHEAQDLLRWCAEHQTLVQSAFDEQARAALECARAALDRDDFAEARLFLNAIADDPATPAYRVEQSRKLLDQVEQREQTLKRQNAVLEQARAALSRGQLAETETRLAALAAEVGLESSFGQSARELLNDLRQLQIRSTECEQQLAVAEHAWEAGDADVLDEHLAKLPPELPLTALAERRTKLVAAAAALRAARENLDKARRWAEAGNFSAARTLAARIAAATDLPHPLTETASALERECEVRFRAQNQAAADRAQAALAEAERLLGEGEPREAAYLLKGDVLAVETLPDELATAARGLLARSNELAQAEAELDHIAACIPAGEFDTAATELAQITRTDWPARFAHRAAEIQAAIAVARTAAAQQRWAALAGELPAAAQALAAGQLDHVAGLLRRVGSASDVPPELAGRFSALQRDFDCAAAILATLSAADAALARGDAPAASDVLERGDAMRARPGAPLPADLPPWAARRAEDLRTRVAAALENRRNEELAQLRALLETAEQAAARGDAAAAESALADWPAGASLPAEFTPRRERLAAQVRQFREWEPRLAAFAARLEQQDWSAVLSELQPLMKTVDLPAALAEALAALARTARTGIAERRQAIASAIEALAVELRHRGRRAPDFLARLDALRADPLATPAHHSHLDELRKAYAAVPAGAPRRWPLGVAAACILLAAGAGGWLWFKGSGAALPVVSHTDGGAAATSLASAEQFPPQVIAVEDGRSEKPPTATDVPPSDADLRERLAANPPALPATISLAAVVRTASPALADLIAQVGPALQLTELSLPPFALAQATISPASAEQPLAFETPAGPLAARLILTPTAAGDDWDWSVAVTEENLPPLASWLFARISEQAAALGDSGRLAAAWEILGPVRAADERLRAEAWFARDLPPLPSLPAAWASVWPALQQAGYSTRGAWDEALGYPGALADRAGRELLLVALPPSDPVWELVERPPPTGSWWLGYVDSGEFVDQRNPPNSLSEAHSAAETLGRRLPTVREWQRAALKLAGNPRAQDLLGGYFEWCVDDGGQGWVCGGCTLRDPSTRRPLAATAPADSTPQAVWQWLQSPLICQPRAHGDDLAAVRPILRIFPN